MIDKKEWAFYLDLTNFWTFDKSHLIVYQFVEVEGWRIEIFWFEFLLEDKIEFLCDKSFETFENFLTFDPTEFSQSVFIPLVCFAVLTYLIFVYFCSFLSD